MNNFLEASRIKLRINSSKGLLSVEQLWDLSLKDLDALAVLLEQEKEKSGKKSFLTETSSEDKVAKLKFDIVFDILTIKVEENKALKESKDKKEHNEKIMAILNQRKDSRLNDLSDEELYASLKR